MFKLRPLEPELAQLAVAPVRYDSKIPFLAKVGVVAIMLVIAFAFDRKVAAWVIAHPTWFWDLASNHPHARKGDIARDLIWLEQFGHWAATTAICCAVGLLDPKGRRRGLAIAAACFWTFVVTHLLKDTFGRTRPNMWDALHIPPGTWIWGGPEQGFRLGAGWASFPSGHTSAAFALASALAWFYPRGRILFMYLAVVTAIQRVLHEAHFISDVIAGMAVGVCVSRIVLSLNIAGRSIACFPGPMKRWWMNQEAWCWPFQRFNRP